MVDIFNTSFHKRTPVQSKLNICWVRIQQQTNCYLQINVGVFVHYADMRSGNITRVAPAILFLYRIFWRNISFNVLLICVTVEFGFQSTQRVPSSGYQTILF